MAPSRLRCRFGRSATGRAICLPTTMDAGAATGSTSTGRSRSGQQTPYTCSQRWSRALSSSSAPAWAAGSLCTLHSSSRNKSRALWVWLRTQTSRRTWCCLCWTTRRSRRSRTPAWPISCGASTSTPSRRSSSTTRRTCCSCRKAPRACPSSVPSASSRGWAMRRFRPTVPSRSRTPSPATTWWSRTPSSGTTCWTTRRTSAA
mmetsp:Transcript_939/g.2163  ORF Transcript_939/g.2163 Transcript_939/m.2163 type:complete len:203 (-) Transcript_939:170-778(-)